MTPVPTAEGVLMGMDQRVGLAVGVAGLALLYLVGRGAGLAALTLLVLVALSAGLAMAKWLPRAWFGRQAIAGARAGATAAGISSLGLLAALTVSGSWRAGPLADRSHWLGIDYGPAVRALAGLGGPGAALVLVLAAVGLATALAAGVTRAAAWDKDHKAVAVVERARQAAQRTNRLPGARPRGGYGVPSGAPAATAPGWSAPRSPASDAAPSAWPALQTPGPDATTPSAGGAVAPAQATTTTPAPPAAGDAFNPWLAPRDVSATPPASEPPADPAPRQPEKDSWLC